MFKEFLTIRNLRVAQELKPLSSIFNLQAHLWPTQLPL